MARTKKEEKRAMVTKMLNQSVYMEQSGLRIQLTNALLRLSRITLSQLQIIIDVKLNDVKEEFDPAVR